jgi:hypothetical protein
MKKNQKLNIKNQNDKLKFKMTFVSSLRGFFERVGIRGKK